MPGTAGHPRLGAINLHGSLLPKYRGRAPVNWVLVNGETHTGVTLHYMIEQADAEYRRPAWSPLLHEDTALTLFEKVAQAALELFQKPSLSSRRGLRAHRKIQRGRPTLAVEPRTMGGSTGPIRRSGSIIWSEPSPHPILERSRPIAARSCMSGVPVLSRLVLGANGHLDNCRRPEWRLPGRHRGGSPNPCPGRGEEVISGETWFRRAGVEAGMRLGEGGAEEE